MCTEREMPFFPILQAMLNILIKTKTKLVPVCRGQLLHVLFLDLLSKSLTSLCRQSL